MPRTLLLFAVLFAGGLHAQTVIVKCIDAEGRTMYTTDACPPGQSVKAVKTYEVVKDDPKAQESLRRVDEQMQAKYRADRGGHAASGRSHPDTPRDRQKRDCAAARERAREARRKDHETSKLVRLDSIAAQTCNGL